MIMTECRALKVRVHNIRNIFLVLFLPPCEILYLKRTVIKDKLCFIYEINCKRSQLYHTRLFPSEALK